MILTIETTVQQEKKIDLQVPLFRRTVSERKYIALLDEKTFVAIFDSPGLRTITNSEVSGHEKREIAESLESTDWTSCTETEFLEKYDSVIESISLHPKLAV